ncbi:MAG: hypothetical protein GXP55_14760 [Deltaproteobacteria bacterium]|nr:hypothetical protein [Deltaproteobacteria bacterium]
MTVGQRGERVEGVSIRTEAMGYGGARHGSTLEQAAGWPGAIPAHELVEQPHGAGEISMEVRDGPTDGGELPLHLPREGLRIGAQGEAMTRKHQLGWRRVCPRPASQQRHQGELGEGLLDDG